MSDQSINKFSAQNRFECNRTNLHGAFMILYNSRFIYTEYNGDSVWLGALTSPAPARSRAAGMEPGCAGRGGGDQSINLLVGLNSTYFIMKLKLLSKLRSCVTFGRVEENAKHIDR